MLVCGSAAAAHLFGGCCRVSGVVYGSAEIFEPFITIDVLNYQKRDPEKMRMLANVLGCVYDTAHLLMDFYNSKLSDAGVFSKLRASLLNRDIPTALHDFQRSACAATNAYVALDAPSAIRKIDSLHNLGCMLVGCKKYSRLQGPRSRATLAWDNLADVPDDQQVLCVRTEILWCCWLSRISDVQYVSSYNPCLYTYNEPATGQRRVVKIVRGQDPADVHAAWAGCGLAPAHISPPERVAGAALKHLSLSLEYVPPLYFGSGC